MKKYDGVDGIYGGAWRGPVFVLTNRVADTPDDSKVTFLREPIEAAVDIARAAAGKRKLEIFGADVARQRLDAKLIDEIVVHLAPLLLGDGVRSMATRKGSGRTRAHRRRRIGSGDGPSATGSPESPGKIGGAPAGPLHYG